MLLVSTLLDLTSAYKIYPPPRRSLSAPQPFPTKTLAHHIIDVVPYPPAPTSAPRLGWDLRRQEDAFNTVCGYLGGDPNLAATCSAGSHCVLDTQHGVVGCCPDADPVCTTGVFTGCVDGNSPPQTEVNPYVFTCQGGNVCYRNVFEGGFFQYGCGTASDLATSVAASASGITAAPARQTLTFSFTGTPTSLAEPTTLGTVTVPNTMTPQGTATEASSETTKKSSSSTVPTSSLESSSRSTSTARTSQTTHSSWTTPTSSGSPSSASQSSSSSLTSSSASPPSTTSAAPTTSSSMPNATSATSNIVTSSAAPQPSGNDPHSKSHTGAIVGGVIGGVAGLVALLALTFFLLRRRARNASNARVGPTGGPTEYISPMRQSADHGPTFAPLHSNDHDGFETGLPPANLMSVGWGASGRPGQTSRGYGYPPASTGYPSAHQYPPDAGLAAPTVPPRPRGLFEDPESGEESSDHDQVPLTREIDDFSRGFHDALGRIGEEDESGSSFYGSRTNVNEGNGVNGRGGDGPEGPYGGVRPLWQQQRRQSRNLMWM